jgi:hypothetical protein
MPDEPINVKIDRERKAHDPHPERVRDFRNYARGKQRGTLTTAQQRILRGVTGHTFADNVCRMVLLACTSRLQVIRFDCPDAAVSKYLHDLWVLASLPLLFKQVIYAAARDGDHAVTLSWDNKAARVRLTRERWWDGRSGIFVAYDDLDQPTYTVKEWKNEQGLLRRVVYWPDRIERYVQAGEGWQPYRLEGSEWQSAWTDRAGAPIGLPVVHFRIVYTASDSSDDDSDASYGTSELDGGILGVQDEINDIQRDITASARYAGFQMMYGTGITLDKDASGKVKPPLVEPGSFFSDANPAASFGVLPPGDLTQLVEAHKVKLQTVSRMTATPVHMISGDWPSGEALIRAEQPLVEKVMAMGESIGPAAASLMHKATLLANAFGAAGLDTGAMISTIFAPPDRRDPLTLAQIAEAEAPYVSRREVLRILGKSPDKIEEILREMDADKQSAQELAPPTTNAPDQPQQGEANGNT